MTGYPPWATDRPEPARMRRPIGPQPAIWHNPAGRWEWRDERGRVGASVTDTVLAGSAAAAWHRHPDRRVRQIARHALGGLR